MEKMLEFLKEIANRETNDDEDFVPMEACGSNYDDCYTMGRDDGEIYLARQLLKQFDPK